MSRKTALAHARAFFRDSFIPQALREARKTADYRSHNPKRHIAKTGKGSDLEAQNKHFSGKNRVKLGHFPTPKFIYSATKIKKEGI